MCRGDARVGPISWWPARQLGGFGSAAGTSGWADPWIAPRTAIRAAPPWMRAYRTPLLAEEEIVRNNDGIRLTSPPAQSST